MAVHPAAPVRMNQRQVDSLHLPGFTILFAQRAVACRLYVYKVPSLITIHRDADTVSKDRIDQKVYGAQ